MRLNHQYYYILFGLIAVFGAACSDSTPTNKNANIAVVTNANIAVPPAANAAAAPSAPPTTTATTGNPSAAIATYYQAMVKKDEAAFRKVLSKATLAEFSANARAEGTNSLVEYWTGYSSPPKQPFQTRNERISGDVALVQINDSETGQWGWKQLVREDGEWKLDLTDATNEKMDKLDKGK